VLHSVIQFANTSSGATASSDLLGSLGIDWKMLLLQTIAFLLLLFVLSKYVYPILMKMIDDREKKIEESVKAAHDAEKSAAEASEKTAKLMKQARKDADELVASAKLEATAMVESAEKKSRVRAEQIAADAEAEIAKSVAAARQALRQETIGLVAEATEKVVGKTVNAGVDKKVIAEAVKEAES